MVIAEKNADCEGTNEANEEHVHITLGKTQLVSCKSMTEPIFVSDETYFQYIAGLTNGSDCNLISELSMQSPIEYYELSSAETVL
jgi:hypothetical protein